MPSAWSGPNTWVGGLAVGQDAVLIRVGRCSDPALTIDECLASESGAEVNESIWRGTVVP